LDGLAQLGEVKTWRFGFNNYLVLSYVDMTEHDNTDPYQQKLGDAAPGCFQKVPRSPFIRMTKKRVIWDGAERAGKRGPPPLPPGHTQCPDMPSPPLACVDMRPAKATPLLLPSHPKPRHGLATFGNAWQILARVGKQVLMPHRTCLSEAGPVIREPKRVERGFSGQHPDTHGCPQLPTDSPIVVSC
jgi:hypothetical protein